MGPPEHPPTTKAGRLRGRALRCAPPGVGSLRGVEPAKSRDAARTQVRRVRRSNRQRRRRGVRNRSTQGAAGGARRDEVPAINRLPVPPNPALSKSRSLPLGRGQEVRRSPSRPLPLGHDLERLDPPQLSTVANRKQQLHPQQASSPVSPQARTAPRRRRIDPIVARNAN